jgi:hypothetical protein
MLCQQGSSCLASRAATGGRQRAAAAAPSPPPRRATSVGSCRGRTPLLVRALPVPDGDVIESGDKQMLVSLEERFRMADIDG